MLHFFPLTLDSYLGIYCPKEMSTKLIIAKKLVGMELPKIEERALWKCLLCDVSVPSKYKLVQHIHRHLTYRKYQCSSCKELFYTEEESDVHCLERGHIRLCGTRVSAYCALYVNMLMKDAVYAFHNGTEAAVMQRIKANLECDFAENSTSETLPTEVHAGDALLGHDQFFSSALKEFSASCDQETFTEISGLPRDAVLQGIRHQSLLYLNCSEKGVSKVIDINTYGMTRETNDPSESMHQCAREFSWLCSLITILPRVLKKADILHLEIDEGLTDMMMLVMTASCLSNASCRVHILTIAHLLADSVSQSTLFKFFRDIARTGIRLLELHTPGSLSRENFLFIVTRPHFYLSCAEQDTIPDSILECLTATDFCIASPNEISYYNMKSFAERLANGSGYPNPFEQCSLESMKNTGLKLINVPKYVVVVSTELFETEKRSDLDDFTNPSFIPCYL